MTCDIGRWSYADIEGQNELRRSVSLGFSDEMNDGAITMGLGIAAEVNN